MSIKAFEPRKHTSIPASSNCRMIFEILFCLMRSLLVLKIVADTCCGEDVLSELSLVRMRLLII